jgi:N-acetylmuramoyl-L-alanine amidase
MNRYLVFVFILIASCKPKKVIIGKAVIMAKVDTVVVKDKPIVILDAGHGGPDPGAINDSLTLYEKNVTRQIVDAVLSIVDTNKVTVIQTRPKDNDVHRHDRIALANSYKPDLLFTAHINFDKDTLVNGFEMELSDSLVVKMDEKDTISMLNPNKEKALKIATVFNEKIAALFPEMKNRNVVIRKDRIWMVCAGKYPSVLMEFGFISSNKDLMYLTDKKAIKKLAGGIVNCFYKLLLPKVDPKKVKKQKKQKAKSKK